MQGRDSNFYGTTQNGGAVSGGSMFQINANGELTTLFSFPAGPADNRPNGLVQGLDGNFYGTIGGYGAVFKIDANGTPTSLCSLPGYTDGQIHNSGLVQGRDGNLYGTTSGLGIQPDYGTVFRISTNGALSILHSFTGVNDGADPEAGLAQGLDGNFYGTTSGGGASWHGTVFRISTNGALSILYSFTGVNDGADPEAGLVQGSDGSFYGTTARGGVGGVGTVFRVTIVREPPVFQAMTLANRTLSLTWSTEVGATYQLQFNSDLGSSNWANLGGAVTAAGATLNLTDFVTDGPRRFYRVVLLP